MFSIASKPGGGLAIHMDRGLGSSSEGNASGAADLGASVSPFFQSVFDAAGPAAAATSEGRPSSFEEWQTEVERKVRERLERRMLPDPDPNDVFRHHDHLPMDGNYDAEWAEAAVALRPPVFFSLGGSIDELVGHFVNDHDKVGKARAFFSELQPLYNHLNERFTTAWENGATVPQLVEMAQELMRDKAGSKYWHHGGNSNGWDRWDFDESKFRDESAKDGVGMILSVIHSPDKSKLRGLLDDDGILSLQDSQRQSLIPALQTETDEIIDQAMERLEIPTQFDVEKVKSDLSVDFMSIVRDSQWDTFNWTPEEKAKFRRGISGMQAILQGPDGLNELGRLLGINSDADARPPTRPQTSGPSTPSEQPKYPTHGSGAPPEEEIPRNGGEVGRNTVVR